MKFIAFLTAALFAGGAAVAQTGKPASAGVFSAAQAERGAKLYGEHCASCHGAAMEGADVNPSLASARFLGAWVGQPMAELTDRIRTTMPLDNPGSLGQADATAIATAILKANGFPAGEAEMPASASALAGYTIDAPRK